MKPPVFDRNVGGLDRLLRAILAAVLAVVAVAATVEGMVVLAIASGAGALGAGFNVTVGWCGVNAICGFDTTRD